jgi:hypothetical protein
VDLNRSFIWDKIIKKARASCGTVVFPVKKGSDWKNMSDEELAKVSGSDPLGQTPEILTWLKDVKKGEPLTIGNYTYLDGALHVQLSLACDAIIEGLCQHRKKSGVSICFLCTPTDIHVRTPESTEAATKAYKAGGISGSLALNVLKPLLGLKRNTIRGGTVKTSDGGDLHLVDGLAIAQGPSYALAKRLQHWRAVVAQSKGHIVATNVAPSTATKSVVHNAQFAAAYGGMHHFKPMEVMYQETSLAVMGAIMLHDLSNPEGAANPRSSLYKNFSSPFELFMHGSFHGGVWRCAFTIDSIGVGSVVAYYLSKYKFLVSGGVAGMGVLTQWILTGNVPQVCTEVLTKVTEMM